MNPKLVLNQWVTVGSASQTRAVATSSGYVNFTLTYYLEAMLTSQSVALNTSYGKVRARVTRSGGTSYSSNMTASCSHCSTYSGVATPEKVLTEGTWWMSHLDDGTGSLLLEGDLSAVVGGFSISIRNAWGDAPTIPRASKPSYSSNPLTIGQTQTITTNRATSSFTHTLVLSVGEYSETLENVGESTTWTPSTATLMPYMDTWQKEVTVTCTTYNGSTTIGSSTTKFTLQVDTSVYKPNITVGTLTDANASTAGLTDGTFIRNKSMLSVPITVESNNTTYDDIVASSTATLGGTTVTRTGSSSGLGYIFNATTTTADLVITATDQRGYTVTKTVTLTLLEYSNISISSVEYARVNANNVETETGEHIRYTIKGTAFLGSFGRTTNAITVASQSKLASASAYGTAITEQTYTTSGNGMGEFTITGVSQGIYSPSSQFDVIYTLTDALSSAMAVAIRIHEGVPVVAWGADHFDVYGEFHIHDREDVAKYRTFKPTGYHWNLLGTATASNPVTFDSSGYAEIMLILEYAENANYTWSTSTVIPVEELSDKYLYCMMPARIAPTTASDFGGVVRIKEDSANAFEFFANRASQTPTLKVYAR